MAAEQKPISEVEALVDEEATAAAKDGTIYDTWLDDEDISSTAVVSRHDWNAIAKKAMERPGMWLLVSPSGPPSTAANITNGRIKTLLGEQYTGWVFRGKVVGIDTSTTPWRGSIWIRADRSLTL
jgi:hypothetical protein